MTGGGHQDPSFATPPWTDTVDGHQRRVGIEMEMGGIEPQDMAEAVIGEIGGSFRTASAFCSHVTDTELGDFRIELDAELLKSRAYKKKLAEHGIEISQGDRLESFEQLLSKLVGLVVPLELVSPPVSWTELPRLDRIRKHLNRAGARGTRSSLVYAFGLQLNVEAASLEGDHLWAMLQAFLLSQDRLLKQNEINFARRITPYIQPYPEDYRIHVLQHWPATEITTRSDDFLYYSPTRNRALDMLPLFAHIDEARVMAAAVEKALIRPRPAFHYRLPDCRVDDPAWSLAEAWNDWVEIERLAADPDRLELARRDGLADASVISSLWSSATRWIRS